MTDYQQLYFDFKKNYHGDSRMVFDAFLEQVERISYLRGRTDFQELQEARSDISHDSSCPASCWCTEQGNYAKCDKCGNVQPTFGCDGNLCKPHQSKPIKWPKFGITEHDALTP